MEQLNDSQIQSFLREVGRRFPATATLLLLGGSALNLLGHPRPTLDIDYVGDDVRKNDLQRIIDQVAEAMQIDVEAVPIGQFVPLPAGADERKLFVGAYGSIDVYILDPYTIALSKLDRGFDTDTVYTRRLKKGLLWTCCATPRPTKPTSSSSKPLKTIPMWSAKRQRAPWRASCAYTPTTSPRKPK